MSRRAGNKQPAVYSGWRRHSTAISFALNCGSVWTVWLGLMIVTDNWHLFADNWFMSVTMAFGSFIAGATSEGGGAVAFPVMTLAFNIAPHVARDFSLMIQSVGMTAASLTILLLGIRVEKRALFFGALGGGLGIILGLEFVAPHLSPAHSKLFFTSTWLAFAFALYWINRYRNRQVLARITDFGPRDGGLLVGTGIIGGVVSGITGSGLDITTFSLLVLRFRINEKVATPTSVVLMASNALVGVAWKSTLGAGLATEAWSYWWVCVPVVVVGAPAGAWFIAKRSRLFVSAILYSSIAVQFVAAMLLIPLTIELVVFSAGVFSVGLMLFNAMARRGVHHLRKVAMAR